MDWLDQPIYFSMISSNKQESLILWWVRSKEGIRVNHAVNCLTSWSNMEYWRVMGYNNGLIKIKKMITMYISYIIGCNDANKGLKCNHKTIHQDSLHVI